MNTRAIATRAAVILVVVLGLALLYTYRALTPPVTVSSTPDPSVTVVAPSPTATVSAAGTIAPSSPSSAPSGAIASDDFGFVVTDNIGQTSFRTETNNARIASFSSRGFAVSLDGTRFAFWTQGPTEAAGGPQELRIVTVAGPTALVASSRLSENERGGAIVWSNDGRGLSYAVHTGAAPTTSAVRIWDLGSGGAGRVVLSSTQPGAFYVPIAWDHTRLNLVAAGLSGEGGFMTNYVTVSTEVTGSERSAKVPFESRIIMFTVRASSDAMFVLGLEGGQAFSYWPIAEFSAKRAPAEAKYGKTGAAWRPGTHTIGFIGPSNQFWLCDVERDTPLGCGTTAFSGVPDGAFLQTFRADGSAVLLGVSPSGSTSPTNYTLVRFGTDPKATSGDRVNFTDASGMVASVRFR